MSWTHRTVTFLAGSDPHIPYEAEIDGTSLRVRLNDFPQEASLYTLFVDDAVAEELLEWPALWRRPDDEPDPDDNPVDRAEYEREMRQLAQTRPIRSSSAVDRDVAMAYCAVPERDGYSGLSCSLSDLATVGAEKEEAQEWSFTHQAVYRCRTCGGLYKFVLAQVRRAPNQAGEPGWRTITRHYYRVDEKHDGQTPFPMAEARSALRKGSS